MRSVTVTIFSPQVNVKEVARFLEMDPQGIEAVQVLEAYDSTGSGQYITFEDFKSLLVPQVRSEFR